MLMKCKAILALLAGSAALYGQAGQISGVVTDDAGTPVSGASVRAVARSYDPTADKRSPILQFLPVLSKDGSGAKGEFVVSALQPGSYAICAEKPGSGLLDPCVWKGNPEPVVVKAGSSASGVTVQMERGAVVTIQVTDPKGHLLGVPAKDDIRVGTSRPEWVFIPARISGLEGSGKTLSLDVPAEQALNLIVQSANFSLTDDQDKALAAGSATIAVPGQARPVEGRPASATPTVVIRIAAPAGGKQ